MMLQPVDLTVVVCSFNGAATIATCLRALASQTVADRIEVVVVDDGSTDGTADVAARYGAVVIQHSVNRGLAAARNTGAHHGSAPIIAYTDDDCEPSPTWAEHLLEAYQDTGEAVIAVGGAVTVAPGRSWLLGFLTRNNPLGPLELDLAKSERVVYRLAVYLRRQWRGAGRSQQPRGVYSLVGANMSIRREALSEVGLFDERFRFGAEELDLFKRLRRRYPGAILHFTPAAVVIHHFKDSLRDSMRRSRSYGRGAARLYRKWPTMRPTVYPAPILVAFLVIAAVKAPVLALAAAAVPYLIYSAALRTSVIRRSPGALLDPYLLLTLEACTNAGFFGGLWPRDGIEQVPKQRPGSATGGALTPYQ